jgi:hypothetical protein
MTVFIAADASFAKAYLYFFEQMHYLLLRHRKISAFSSSTTDQHAGDLFQKVALSSLRKYN